MSRLSPAKRHFERVMAQKSEKLNPAGIPEKGSDYELQLKKLYMDKHRLKQIQSLEQKTVVKAEILPEYQPYVDGVLEGGKGAQDEVLTTVLVWHTLMISGSCTSATISWPSGTSVISRNHER